MKSMTGYGSSEGGVGEGLLFAEVRSINSRFLDINCKIPPYMFVLEPKIKKFIQNRVIRGKVEVFLKEKKEFSSVSELQVNKQLVKQYRACLKQITAMLGIKASSHLLEVVDLKDLVVFREKPVRLESMWRQMEKVILGAMKKMEAMRTAEGRAIEKDQTKQLKRLGKLLLAMERRLSTRPCDVSYVDVTEELTRFKSHIGQYRSIMKGVGAVGRQLDFLIQEMHREVNTLGSKSCDAKISGLVVEVKTEIEKLREQIQNIE